MSQRDSQAMRDLMEVCCLWNAIKEAIRLDVGDNAFLQCEEMFIAGSLGPIISLEFGTF